MTAIPRSTPPYGGTIGRLTEDCEPAPLALDSAPDGAPNVVVVLLDDVGFGAFSSFGGPVDAPGLERVAAEGLRFNRFHTTAICAPTRATLLTGRNHHTVHMGRITEAANSFPAYDSVIPREAATVAEVERAVEELDRQASQLRLVGRTFLLDLVMQAPVRFSTAVRAALEAELPSLRPAVVRSRFHLREEAGVAAMVATLRDVRRRRSHGVVLKAPDHPDVAAEVAALADAGVPVVTLVTDVPRSRRLAYVGIDNDAAGRTAAYLVAQGAPASGAVLVTLSRSDFRGEEQRVSAFVDALHDLSPARRVVDLTDTDGLDPTTGAGVRAALAPPAAPRRPPRRADVGAVAGPGRDAVQPPPCLHHPLTTPSPIERDQPH